MHQARGVALDQVQPASPQASLSVLLLLQLLQVEPGFSSEQDAVGRLRKSTRDRQLSTLSSMEASQAALLALALTAGWILSS